MIKNSKEFVELVENTLGWAPPPDKITDKTPLWKHRMIMAGRVKKKIAEDPRLYTWHNLELTVEYCRRKKIAIQSPLGVFWKVKAAVDTANVTDTGQLEAQINEAIEWELEHQQPEHSEWVGRLVRADGSARADVLALWQRERRGHG